MTASPPELAEPPLPRVEFYRHALGADELAAVRRVLEGPFLTMGPETAAFERELAEWLSRGRSGPRPHAVATSSCSMGLLLALRALGVGPGDEVITTPITFVATQNAILHLGARPVLADVEPETGLLDPEAVRAAIGPRTVGILPVHLYGQLADMRALRALADRAGLFVLEDSAHGVEIERDGVRPGDLGDAAVFSFYATKTMTSGDGGAVVTSLGDVAERLRRLRNHGVSKSAAERHGGSYAHWDLLELGYKANLSDIEAALLRPQLARLDARRAARQRLVERYEALLSGEAEGGPSARGVPALTPRRGTSSHHLFTFRVPSAGAGPDERDRVLARLGAAGIGTAVNYRAVHGLRYFAETLGVPWGALPVAEEIGDRTLSLPLHPTLGASEQDRVVGALRAALRGPR